MKIQNTDFNAKEAVKMGQKQFVKTYEGTLKNPEAAFKQLEKAVGKPKAKKEKASDD
jgi:hypothetical protein